jgi:hypothetical protein
MKQKFKAGDKVKCIDVPNYNTFFKLNKVYTIKGSYADLKEELVPKDSVWYRFEELQNGAREYHFELVTKNTKKKVDSGWGW